MIKYLKFNFYRFLANFTFGNLRQFYINKKNKYKQLIIQEKNKANIIINGVNNRYNTDILTKLGVKLTVNGDNNEIIIGKDSSINNNLSIVIHGSNNKIDIDDIIIGQNLRIIMGFPTGKTQNSRITIGYKSRFVDTEIMLLEEGSILEIGEDCMFSENVLIHLSDTHSIFDLDGNLINYGGHVKIRNRVWVCRDARILKKAVISDDTVVGGSSVVAGKFLETNCIIAGNPAKIVKRGIKWSCNHPQYSKDNNREYCKAE